MRYLVRDRSNGKLIGIFALGDPVFNLKARDEWIGWNQAHSRDHLTNVMDACVVGIKREIYAMPLADGFREVLKRTPSLAFHGLTALEWN